MRAPGGGAGLAAGLWQPVFDEGPRFAYADRMPYTPPLLSQPPTSSLTWHRAWRPVVVALALAGLAAAVPACVDMQSADTAAGAGQADGSASADTEEGPTVFVDELYADPGECEDPGQGVRTMCVLDGDTILLDDGLNSKVRMLGVAAPEIAHGSKPAECYGVKAWTLVKQWLVVEQYAKEDVLKESELKHMYVCVRPDPSAANKDDFGRLLRYVYLRDAEGKAVQLNARLIRQGAARLYTAFSKGLRHEKAFKTRETSARNEGLGGWATCNWSPR